MRDMEFNEQVTKYLDLIRDRLQENRASLFVGAGFSLNADRNGGDKKKNQI